MVMTSGRRVGILWQVDKDSFSLARLGSTLRRNFPGSLRSIEHNPSLAIYSMEPISESTRIIPTMATQSIIEACPK